MIRQVISTSLISFAGGILLQLAQEWLVSYFFTGFLRANLINILVALLAINSATMGIVLTKIRDLVDRHGNGEAFAKTRSHMLLSVKEQLWLIGAAIVVLTLSGSPYVANFAYKNLIFNGATAAVFIYAMTILYDTAKGVLIIVDFEQPETAPRK